MKLISKFIRSLDQIGPEVGFKYKERKRVQTIFGGLLMICITVVGVLGFGYFSRDIFFKMNPITKTNTLFADEKIMRTWDLPLSLSLTDVFFGPIDKTHPVWESVELWPEFVISATKDGSSNVQIGYFGTMPCSKEYFGKFSLSYDITITDNAICIDYDTKFKLDGTPWDVDFDLIKGKFGVRENLIDIKLKMCDEKKKPGCSNALKEAGQIQFFLSTVGEIINFDNYEKPLDQNIGYLNGNVTAGLFVRKYLKVYLNNFISDDGWIIQNRSETAFLEMKLEDTNIASFNENTRNLYAYNVDLSIEEKILERRYVRIQEILANIGGFIKLLLFVATLLTQPFAQYYFYKEFGAEINKMVSEAKGKQLKNNFVDKALNQSSNQVLSTSKILPPVKADVNFFEFIRALFSKSKVDSSKVFNYLEISYLTKRIIEVEHLTNKQS